ncbi:hypothetical protein LY76DRAFT_236541 [Colletotrichum caudatum]|nr:hypothetical protein LY76DRAFT_236541 [Colletotrichum caudatum]
MNCHMCWPIRCSYMVLRPITYAARSTQSGGLFGFFRLESKPSQHKSRPWGCATKARSRLLLVRSVTHGFVFTLFQSLPNSSLPSLSRPAGVARLVCLLFDPCCYFGLGAHAQGI